MMQRADFLVRLLFFVVLLGIAGRVQAQDVIFQDFYWDTVPAVGQSWWGQCEKELPELASAGVGCVWVPAPYKGGAGRDDMGYGPYDLYDLGDKAQKGTVATRFGTKSEFLRFVGTAHRLGIKVYADVVLNHAMGANYAEPNPVMAKLGWTDIQNPDQIPLAQRSPTAKPGDILRSWTGFAPVGADGQPGTGRFPRTWRDFHPNEAEPDRNGPYHQKEFGEDYAYRGDGEDDVRHSLIAWSLWFQAQTGVDGYRLDDVKGIEPDFVHDFITGSRPGLWMVGEYLDGDPAKLMAYLHETGDALHLYDYPLYFALRDMTFRPEAFDMRDLLRRRMPDRRHAVTFIGNHDMSRTDSAILYNPIFAQALILAMSGMPSVYYSDYWKTGPAQRRRIGELIGLHNSLAQGEELIRAADCCTLAIERRGHLLAVFNSGGDRADHVVTAMTAFAPGTRLLDRAGNGAAVVTDSQGRVSVRVAPFQFAYYAPQSGAGKRLTPRSALPTRQTWEFADDLSTGRLTKTPSRIGITLSAGQTLAVTTESEPNSEILLRLTGPAGQILGESAHALRVRAMRGGEYQVSVWIADGPARTGKVTLAY